MVIFITGFAFGYFDVSLQSDHKKRPVLFFVHGGGFAFGSGDVYGAKYLLEYDLVLVTINYRVGILG